MQKPLQTLVWHDGTLQLPVGGGEMDDGGRQKSEVRGRKAPAADQKSEIIDPNCPGNRFCTILAGSALRFPLFSRGFAETGTGRGTLSASRRVRGP